MSVPQVMGVVGAGVAQHDAAGVQGELEHGASAGGGTGRCDGAVVAQDAGGIAVLGGGLAVAGVDVGAYLDEPPRRWAPP